MDKSTVKFTSSTPQHTLQYQGREPGDHIELREGQNPYKIALARLTGEDTFTEEDPIDETVESFPCGRLLITNISMVLYILDVWTDISLVVKYYINGDFWWFGLTLVFVTLPTMINGAAVMMYMMQRKVTIGTSLLYLLATILQIAPILRYMSINLMLVHIWRGKSMKRHVYRKRIDEGEGLANFWRMVECFSEALPQLCLQIYILSLPDGPRVIKEDSSFIEHATVSFQSACIVTSLASAGWTLLSLNLWIYTDDTTISNTTAIPVLLHGLWFFLLLTSRVLAIALSATYFRGWIFVLLVIHWLVVFVYHYIKSKAKLPLIVVQTWASMFYLSYTETDDELDGGYVEVVQWGHVFFYVMVYVENALMIVTWYLFTQTLDLWYQGYALAVVLGGFFVGAFCQLLYFVWYDGRYERAKEKVFNTCCSKGKDENNLTQDRDRDKEKGRDRRIDKGRAVEEQTV